MREVCRDIKSVVLTLLAWEDCLLLAIGMKWRLKSNFPGYSVQKTTSKTRLSIYSQSYLWMITNNQWDSVEKNALPNQTYTLLESFVKTWWMLCCCQVGKFVFKVPLRQNTLSDLESNQTVSRLTSSSPVTNQWHILFFRSMKTQTPVFPEKTLSHWLSNARK